MVRLAGAVSGRGRLLDPFCGSGTILAAAIQNGWFAYGADNDRSALDVARTNTRAPLLAADAISPPFADGSFGAIVSNLPFGKQFGLGGSVERVLMSLRPLLAEDGRVVVLTARDSSVPKTFTIERQMDVELLGQPATLWSLQSDAMRPRGRAP
jgi:tRNA G10  N-methylase Trm11